MADCYGSPRHLIHPFHLHKMGLIKAGPACIVTAALQGSNTVMYVKLLPQFKIVRYKITLSLLSGIHKLSFLSWKKLFQLLLDWQLSALHYSFGYFVLFYLRSRILISSHSIPHMANYEPLTKISAYMSYTSYLQRARSQNWSEKTVLPKQIKA